MGFGALFALAFGVSMDAFAVSMCKGLAMKRASLKAGLTCGIWFGGFQALMPLIGYFLGSLFANAVTAIDHWIACALLAVIGANMLKDVFFGCDECQQQDSDISPRKMFPLAIATSIDALAVGISLATSGNTNIWIAISLIGLTTCAFCTVGVKIGNVFGSRFEKWAQIAGGATLILLGVKILVEHLMTGV